MIDNDVFFEKPEAKSAFFKWFNSRNPRGYDLDKMPEFMSIPVIVAFLDAKGLYIDRETTDFSYLIWDFREGEPIDPIFRTDNSRDSMEDTLKDAIEFALNLLYPINLSQQLK